MDIRVPDFTRSFIFFQEKLFIVDMHGKVSIDGIQMELDRHYDIYYLFEHSTSLYALTGTNKIVKFESDICQFKHQNTLIFPIYGMIFANDIQSKTCPNYIRGIIHIPRVNSVLYKQSYLCTSRYEHRKDTI